MIRFGRMLKCAVAVMTLLAVSLLIVRGRHVQAEELAPVGKYTGPQAIQRAAPWIWRLVRFRPDLVLTAEPNVSTRGVARPYRQWTVICNDAGGAFGGDRAIVIFDADTSRLRYAAKIGRVDADGPRAKNPREAARMAVDWLTDLGEAEGPEEWVVVSSTTADYSWVVRVRNGQRTAAVVVDRKSGDIRCILLSP